MRLFCSFRSQMARCRWTKNMCDAMKKKKKRTKGRSARVWSIGSTAAWENRTVRRSELKLRAHAAPPPPPPDDVWLIRKPHNYTTQHNKVTRTATQKHLLSSLNFAERKATSSVVLHLRSRFLWTVAVYLSAIEHREGEREKRCRMVTFTPH